MSAAANRLLAFDFGLKRIGVAAGNRLTATATPVTTLSPGAPLPWTAIDALIAEWQPDLLVVGDPGPEADGRLRETLGEFLAGLGARSGLPVETVDESFSSAEAASRLRAGREKGLYNRRLKKDRIDRLAACLIAEQWMNQALERN